MAAVNVDVFVEFTPPAGGGITPDCTQYTSNPKANGGILYARPALSKSGDTAKWHGPFPGDEVTVTFAAAAPYGPFPQPSYKTGDLGVTPTGGQSDYTYTNVQIVRTVLDRRVAYTCTTTSVQGMGVHVTN